MGAGTMPSRVDDVAAAVLSLAGPMEAMRLQKLVYYSQAWHLALTDEPLFADHVQAWRDGPVVPSLWRQHRGQRRVAQWAEGSVAGLPPRSAEIIGLVCQVYGGLSGDDLSELTHSEAPWRDARKGLADDASSNAPISSDAMKTYYRRRTLAGRGVADLVAGGLNGPANPEIDAQARRELFAQIRAQFADSPQHDEGLPEPIGSTFREQHSWDLEPGVTVRMNRERPTRARASR